MLSCYACTPHGSGVTLHKFCTHTHTHTQGVQMLHKCPFGHSHKLHRLNFFIIRLQARSAHLSLGTALTGPLHMCAGFWEVKVFATNDHRKKQMCVNIFAHQADHLKTSCMPHSDLIIFHSQKACIHPSVELWLRLELIKGGKLLRRIVLILTGKKKFDTFAAFLSITFKEDNTKCNK